MGLEKTSQNPSPCDHRYQAGTNGRCADCGHTMTAAEVDTYITRVMSMTYCTAPKPKGWPKC